MDSAQRILDLSVKTTFLMSVEERDEFYTRAVEIAHLVRDGTPSEDPTDDIRKTH